MSEPMNRISLAAPEMNQPNWVHPDTAQVTQAPAAMAPSATPGFPPGHAHGTSHPIHAYPAQCAYNLGAAPHAPYPYALGYQYHPQGAYPVVMPPPPQPAPNRKRGFFMACFEAVLCCCLKNTNLGDVNGGDVSICGDCFGAGDICFM